MKTRIYLLTLLMLPLASCNDWLTITPEGQVEAGDLLTNENGYNSALGGIYYILSDSKLYGQELSFGMMDILAQYWDISNNLNHHYYKISQYDYKDASATAKLDAIWKELYSSVTQCNLILASLEKNRENIQYSGLMEGEAYGLRAFAHIELFRLFGPVIQQESDLDQLSIAYRTEFNVVSQKFESGKSVLNKARTDLLRALDLLKDDPIQTTGRKGDLNTSPLGYNHVLNRRGSRMNYYAVLGLLARLEQLMLNQEQAYQYAKRIIDELKETEAIYFIDKNAIATSKQKDLNFSSEMLFALYTNNLYDLTNNAFLMDGEGNSNTAFEITSDLYTTFLNQVYGRQPDGSGTDIRLRSWFSSTGGSHYDFLKLKKADQEIGIQPAYDPEVAIIRLSEIYYIACEAQIGKDNNLALSYLNDVRETRNLPKLNGPLSDEEILEYMVRDARKDFIGEGRMFPLYKRLFRPIYVKEGVTIDAVADNFIFPIPEDEYEYTSNEKSINQ